MDIHIYTVYIHVYTVLYISCDRWKDGELKKTIEMLRRPEFDSKELDPDLHKECKKLYRMVASSAST
jgi:hypothetical protein